MTLLPLSGREGAINSSRVSGDQAEHFRIDHALLSNLLTMQTLMQSPSQSYLRKKKTNTEQSQKCIFAFGIRMHVSVVVKIRHEIKATTLYLISEISIPPNPIQPCYVKARPNNIFKDTFANI